MRFLSEPNPDDHILTPAVPTFYFPNPRRVSPRRKELDPAPDGFIRDNPLHSPTGVMNAAVRGRISEDTPWQPPSVEVARRFEDELHLRHPGGGKFAVRGVNMGRYCFLGGCGAQLDLWDEVRRTATPCCS